MYGRIFVVLTSVWCGTAFLLSTSNFVNFPVFLYVWCLYFRRLWPSESIFWNGENSLYFTLSVILSRKVANAKISVFICMIIAPLIGVWYNLSSTVLQLLGAITSVFLFIIEEHYLMFKNLHYANFISTWLKLCAMCISSSVDQIIIISLSVHFCDKL